MKNGRDRRGWRRLSVLAMLLCLLVPGPAEPGNDVCAPGGLLKVVTTLDVPGVAADHFIRAPKTLYRYGSQYGRLEEMPNPATGLHLLVVVNEPHVWMANLTTRTGKYLRDPGPTYYFRARLFDGAAVKSALIGRLEFGCELAWLKASGAIEGRTPHRTLGQVRMLQYAEGEERVILYARGDRPLRLELIQQNRLTVAVDYVEYVTGPVERRLFEKPPGIGFEGEQ